jgi:dihydrofolate synthase / folylpolyglutamate synthase
LDVGHNADGAEVLAQALEETFPGQAFNFVVGMTAGHEPLEFLPPLRGKIAKLWAIEPKFRPRPLQDLLDAAAGLEIPAQAGVDLGEVLGELEDSSLPVVITGSFYNVAEVSPEYRGFQEV